MRTRFLIALFMMIASRLLWAQSGADTALSYYTDSLRTQKNYTLKLKHTTPLEQAKIVLNVNMQTRALVEKDRTSSLVLDLLGGHTNWWQNSFVFAPQIVLNKLNAVGVMASFLKSPIDQTTSLGGNIVSWFMDETFEVSTTFSLSKSQRKKQSFYDARADLIFLPEKVAGESGSIALRYLLSTTRTLAGGYTLTRPSDRPLAHQAFFEMREIFKETASAIALSLAAYRNDGLLRPTTSYGSVDAVSAIVTLKQAVTPSARQGVFELSHRYYRENKDGGDFLAQVDPLASSYTTISLRKILDDGPWATAQNEVYLFAGHYDARPITRGNLLGVGGRYYFE